MTCPWTGKEFPIPRDMCPILWHTLYPYFLGFVFGANYGNEGGSCNVGCPAELGVDLVVKKTPKDPWNMQMWDVPDKWRDVIHAEVVKVNGLCHYGHKEGEIFLFPTFAKENFMCPALIYNAFPFMVGRPEMRCITERLRCPDWKENVFYELA